MATTTENYNLNIVEGTDIVNPLIYDNPNYQKIDEQMFINQNNGIPKASYNKSGTVHQITRSLTKAPVFWFTASNNYKSGDTFKVNGSSVNAVLPDGSTLPNNAFTTNSNVICLLVGSVLTIFSVKENVKTAEKLANAVNIGSASFDGSQSITLEQMGALVPPKLLWSGTFGEGSLTIDGLSDYKFFKVRMDFSNNDTLNTQYNTYVDASLIGNLFAGGGIALYAGTSWAITRFGCSVSGDTITYINGGKMTPDTPANTPRNTANLYEIWGIA